MKMLKTFLLLILLMAAAAGLAAQDITNAEYFFDNDPGHGNATPISLVQNNEEYTYSGSISTSSLSRGLHVLYIRAKNDEGEWGTPSEHMVFVNAKTGSNATMLEYYFGDDPGPGNGSSQTLPESENGVSSAQITLNTGGLTHGVHLLDMRAGNGEGIWGMPVKSMVHISRTPPVGALLTKAEYFLGADPGFEEGNALTLNADGDEYTAEFIISGENFSAGEQQLFVRAAEQGDVWGMYARAAFFNTEVPDLSFENTDTLQYEINDGKLFFAENLSVTAQTDIKADSALIVLADGFLAGEDSLSIEESGSLELTYGAGWIKLTGEDDLDDYEQFLQTAYLMPKESDVYTDTLKRFEITLWNGEFASDPTGLFVQATYYDSTSTASEDELGLPDSFSLSPNYPNPFNPETTIRYSLPEPADVQLKVYNMLGREVAVLVSERKNAGWYTVRVNASGWASGVYLYRLQAGPFTDAGKMTVIK